MKKLIICMTAALLALAMCIGVLAESASEPAPAPEADAEPAPAAVVDAEPAPEAETPAPEAEPAAAE